MRVEIGAQAGHQRPSLADDLDFSKDEREDERILFGEGRFQLRVLLSTAVTGIVRVLPLDAHDEPHWCERPPAFARMSAQTWKRMAVLHYPNGSYSRCTVGDPPDGGPSASAIACDA
ncbi:hypothetical protein HPB48_008088 [Haemaphysalis longicornis]|uniref:Uncharacterized protein n=1 Tax=Haemaphysalis longicornis TaxID=44386 RepID=A0A9J6GXM1_HAELO|nr:hypothetical protein HPB48_008088 [Haemaphysalis longicornis]